MVARPRIIMKAMLRVFTNISLKIDTNGLEPRFIRRCTSEQASVFFNIVTLDVYLNLA